MQFIQQGFLVGMINRIKEKQQEEQREKELKELFAALEVVFDLEKTEVERLAESMMVAAESVNQFSIGIEEALVALSIKEQRNRVIKQRSRKLYFEKQRIEHQVSSRKPRHLVKKVIR